MDFILGGGGEVENHDESRIPRLPWVQEVFFLAGCEEVEGGAQGPAEAILQALGPTLFERIGDVRGMNEDGE